MIGYFLLQMFSLKKKVFCHLCEEIIHRRDWYYANHREVCALRYSDLIKTFPRLKSRGCPLCAGGPLLLWPKRGPDQFTCSETKTRYLNKFPYHVLIFLVIHINMIVPWPPVLVLFWFLQIEADFCITVTRFNGNHIFFELEESKMARSEFSR